MLDAGLQPLRQGGRAVELVVAVVLDLLRGVKPVLVGNAVAAVDLVGQVVQRGVTAGNQRDGVLVGTVARFLDQHIAGFVVLGQFDELDHGLHGVLVACLAGHAAGAAHLQPRGDGE